jgi:hypothetical protein
MTDDKKIEPINNNENEIPRYYSTLVALLPGEHMSSISTVLSWQDSIGVRTSLKIH